MGKVREAIAALEEAVKAEHGVRPLVQVDILLTESVGIAGKSESELRSIAGKLSRDLGGTLRPWESRSGMRAVSIDTRGGSGQATVYLPRSNGYMGVAIGE